MNLTILVIFVMGFAWIPLRFIVGDRHPVLLLPGVVACAAGLAHTRGTAWQWPWLALAGAMAVAIAWLTWDWRKRQRPEEGSGPQGMHGVGR